MNSSLYKYILGVADNCLILGQRLGELCGHGPSLETDIACTNISLDLFGQVRSYYQYAAKVAGDNRKEDDGAEVITLTENEAIQTNNAAIKESVRAEAVLENKAAEKTNTTTASPRWQVQFAAAKVNLSDTYLKGKFKVVGQIGIGLLVGAVFYFHPDVVVKERMTANQQSAYSFDDAISSKKDLTLPKYAPTPIKSIKTTIPFVKDNEFETVICDPPYNGNFQWNHDLLAELSRVASKRIIFQHWFIPANPSGTYKKAQEKFLLSDVLVWQPKTYFGRVQVVSVFDAVS